MVVDDDDDDDYDTDISILVPSKYVPPNLVFISAYAYFLCFSKGPTNQAVHKGFPKPGYGNALNVTMPLKHLPEFR